MISYGPPTPVVKGPCGCKREWFLVVKLHVKTLTTPCVAKLGRKYMYWF